MRRITVLCLLLVLAAPAAPGQATSVPESPAQPALSPALASSVLLREWNERQPRYEIRPVVPATGQAIPGYAPIAVGPNPMIAPHAFSADGSRLAEVESRGQDCESYAGGLACRGSADLLHLIDLPGWREVTAPLPGQGWAGPLAFSPNAAHLALAYHEGAASTLLLFDADSGERLAQQTLDFRPSLLGYVGDGALIAVYGQPFGSTPGISKPGPPRVLLADATTLEVRWDQPLADILSGDWCLENCQASHEVPSFTYWSPAVVLSGDGRALYIVHADEDKLTTVDFEARTVSSVAVEPLPGSMAPSQEQPRAGRGREGRGGDVFRVARSWLERLLVLTADVAHAKGASSGAIKAAALSPDGALLYVVGRRTDSTHDTNGDWQVTQESLGLQVLDVKSGRIIAGRETEAERVRITPEGAYLLLDGWEGEEHWTEALDADNLERAVRVRGWEVVATRRMDGEPIFLASRSAPGRTQFAVLIPRWFSPIHSWSASADASWVVP